MTYAAKQDLLDRYGEADLLRVASQAGDAAALDDDRIARAIADAVALVDLHVRARYAVPLDPVPAEILSVTCALARYALYENAVSVPDQVKAGRDNAMAVLASIRDGDSTLDSAPASDSSAAAIEQLPELAGDDPVMTADKLKAW